MIRAFGLSDKGRVRPVNEDCFAVREALGLCVVADGMGGHKAGEVAAQMAVEAIVDAVGVRTGQGTADRSDTDAWPFGYDPGLSPDGNLLRTAIHLASIQILEAAISTHHYAGMGTTVVAVRVAGDRVSVAHAGDSRLYVFSRGRLRQVTSDDTWLAQTLAADPHADRDALQLHPMSHALTNVVGAMKPATVHVAEETLDAGDVLLLSTDGVHGVLDDWRLEQILLEDDEPRAIAENLVSAALTRGSCDNCTAVVARVGELGCE